MIENPHEYDDDEYLTATLALTSAIGRLWQAGATVENLEDEIQSALDNATDLVADITVSLS